MSVPQLMTEPQAAALLNINPRTLRKVRKLGQIAFVRIGRCVRYSPQEVADYVGRVTVANEVELPKRRRGVAVRVHTAIVPFSKIAKR